MTRVLNGPVIPGDTVAYSVRRVWDMATRIGVVISTEPKSLLVRVVISSDSRGLTRMVRLTELRRVVKLKALEL
jgi:hypothetical protein